MLLSELLINVTSHVSRLKHFRRFSRASREVFVRDVCLIASSIRTGYLVDSISVPEDLVEESYSTLLNDLRELSDSFNDVLHLYEPSSNQSFIVNRTLLFNKLDTLLRPLTPNSYPVYVHLPERDEPCQLDTIPLPLSHLLQTILNELAQISISGLPTTLRLPTNLLPMLCVPLAAILLDYPAAYVPEGDQVSFLSGVPLVLYRCSIIGYPTTRIGQNHSLLQFSCPLSLTDDISGHMSVGRVTSHLKSTFTPRISQSIPEGTFQVDYEHVTLDRVAF